MITWLVILWSNPTKVRQPFIEEHGCRGELVLFRVLLLLLLLVLCCSAEFYIEKL